MKVYLNDKAKETGGVITNSKIGVMIDTAASYVSNDQTAAEVYAHELVHAYTKWTVDMAKDGDVGARKILRQLQKVMRVTQEKVKWEDLLGDVKKEDASTKEIENAKEMYKYIFEHENSEHEFLAHVLTNPVVSKIAKGITVQDTEGEKSIWERAKDLFQRVADFMMGDFKFKDAGKNVYDITSELAIMFAEYNAKSVNKVKNGQGLNERLNEALNDLDEEASARLKGLFEKFAVDKKLGDMPEGKAAKAKWMAKALTLAVTDRDHRDIVMTYLDRLGWLNVSGSIGSIIRDFVENDELETKLDWLQLQADKIDQTKMNLMSVVTSDVKKGFSRELSKEEESVLQEVLLDTDIQSVYGKGVSNRQLKSWLKDEAKLESAIGHAKHELSKMTNNEKRRNWYQAQATGLGYYMATGKGHIAQNINSYNIAKGYLSGEHVIGYHKKKGDIEAAVDKVATLTALKYIGKKKREQVADLLGNEKDGVENMISTHKMLVKEASEELFRGQQTFMIKGYTKELFDDVISVEVGKISDRKEMERKGFKLVSKLENHSKLGKAEYGLYKSNSHTTQNWHRSTARLTKMHTMGTSLKDLEYADNDQYARKKHKIAKNKLDAERYALVKQMSEGTFDVETVERGMLPLVNEEGYVADYRYTMAKDVKRDILKQDTRMSETLGATKGALLDKSRSAIHNQNVLEVIMADARENYIPGREIGKNAKQYVLIKDGSSDEHIQELWEVLPKEYKKMAGLFEEQGLPIRKDMLLNYFGYRELSFSQFPGLSKYMPTVMKSAIRWAEYIWQEFIKISKVDILIKMPFVIIGNLVSNVMFGMTTGSSPVEIFDMYKESFRDVRNYLTKHRKLVELENKVQLGKANSHDKSTIKLLKKQLKENPIHELYELGVYQAIVEDISQAELDSKNRLKQEYKDRTEKVPKIIKDGLNLLYLTEETKYYQVMTETLQMSDLIARDVENRKMKKRMKLEAEGKKKIPLWYIDHLNESKNEFARMTRLKKGFDNRDRKMSAKEKEYFKEMAAEYRKNYVLNAFINYNKVSGPVEEYLNKMGFIMFTKYAKRIQLVIGQTGIQHPIRSLMSLGAGTYFDSLDMIQDQSLFTRSWYNMTPQWPWERVAEVFTPALVQIYQRDL